MSCKPRSLERFECRVHLNTERWGPQIIVIHTGVKIISRCLSVSRCVHEGSFSMRTRFSGPLSFDTSVLWEDPSDKGNLFLMIKWGHKWFDWSFSHFHNIKVWLKWLMVIFLHHGGSFLVVSGLLCLYAWNLWHTMSCPPRRSWATWLLSFFSPNHRLVAGVTLANSGLQPFLHARPEDNVIQEFQERPDRAFFAPAEAADGHTAHVSTPTAQ